MFNQTGRFSPTIQDNTGQEPNGKLYVIFYSHEIRCCRLVYIGSFMHSAPTTTFSSRLLLRRLQIRIIQPPVHLFISVFNCSASYCVLEEIVEKGMTAYRYTLPLDTFNRPKNGSPDCYTLPGSKPHPDGLTDVSPCFFSKLYLSNGSHAWLSMEHCLFLLIK